MATNYPDIEPMLHLDHFDRAKQEIENTYNTLIQKLTERRDKLLEDLHEMKFKYFKEEMARKKHIGDLDQLIKGVEGPNLGENNIVVLREEQLKVLEAKKEKYQIPTLIPFPDFVPLHLEEIQHLIEVFGALQDVATHYTTISRPLTTHGKFFILELMLNHPIGIVLDGKGNFFIADSGSKVIKLINSEGKLLGKFGRGLKWPYAIALSEEFIFVTDLVVEQVIKFNIVTYEMVGMSDVELNISQGIAVDNDEVFVADCYNNRVLVLSLNLDFIRQIRNQNLIRPRDVKVNMNKVFIASKSNIGNPHTILVFSKLGNLLDHLISLKEGIVCLCICFDKFNNILISDFRGKAIGIYTLEGQLVHSIECDYRPTGIAVTQDNIIICADWTNSRIKYY